MMKYQNIREEELKNKVAQHYFADFDTTRIVGHIDFCVTLPMPEELALGFEVQSLLWAEAKKGRADEVTSLVQLILTIGKARTFDEQLPPAFLGAFDAEKIAFIPYSAVQEVFYQNDFNWNVTPSNRDTKEFQQVFTTVKSTLEAQSLRFFFEHDEEELRAFIQENFVEGKAGLSKVRIDKNNFLSVYNKWVDSVKPTIQISWDIAKKKGIIDADFYLADLLSKENHTLKEKLYVLLKNDIYELDRKMDEMGLFNPRTTSFNDEQKAHHAFWNKYERPPKEEYWDYIIRRRDLLVPQDIRERKGSFFTPQIWVELSQKYLTDVLGEDWQDEYYIWDCAAGTGNLLAGLTNKYHIWASTLDKQDVDVMHDRIENGANLLKKHVFQFDFLNDDFSKLPQELQQIINDPEKRKKLVIYINPPYVEATDGIGKGGRKLNVSKETKMYEKYGDLLKRAKNELYAQFFMRIQREIGAGILAQFSTIKHLQSPVFSEFRKNFAPKLEKMFIVPADTFDNVNGKFPIGFLIWNFQEKETFKAIKASVYGAKGNVLPKKKVIAYNGKGYINQWVKQYKVENGHKLGYLVYLGNDFQHAGEVRLSSTKPTSHVGMMELNAKNIILACVYLAVRHCISPSWLNDRDQFLAPKKKWEKDTEFQNDCLTYSLFHGQQKVTSEEGINHWIPFREQEVNAQTKFESNFMTRFIAGKIKLEGNGNLLEAQKVRTTPLEFSAEAQAVFAAGRALWTYYHQQPDANVNASLYDIRAHFQGRNAKGRMNSKSEDETYTQLIGELREALKILGGKIAPKVYEYGFLRA